MEYNYVQEHHNDCNKYPIKCELCQDEVSRENVCYSSVLYTFFLIVTRVFICPIFIAGRTSQTGGVQICEVLLWRSGKQENDYPKYLETWHVLCTCIIHNYVMYMCMDVDVGTMYDAIIGFHKVYLPKDSFQIRLYMQQRNSHCNV